MIGTVLDTGPIVASLGYPLAPALMAAVCGVLYGVFRCRDWL